MHNPPPSVSRLALPGFAGALLLGPCPGRRKEALDEASLQAVLTEDLSRLTEMGANGLLSLVEAKELPGGLDGFATAVRAVKMEWTHLPIPDYGVPDAVFMTGWRRLDLARRLREGESWAIHCRAGLGRTGTIAALLLVESGMSAADAVAHIRREHDAAAVETEAQEKFLITQQQGALRTAIARNAP
ncbi:protein-tyrosine phosphatase family protein [Bosea beijingensis]|uniref:phosphatase domain-containing protein n=1 Tax=Bosea beijingensis TaxID=3068632 RepID=UPI002740CFD3|nr:protein-tyrosine phosphatase family protein [Bosea sp. REN20]